MKKVIILGSTGSIGTQTLEVIDNSNEYQVVGLACGANIKLLKEQIRKYHPYVSESTINRALQKLRDEIQELENGKQ